MERSDVMDFKTFFAELKRRHVYKVGVAYVVVAWLIIQVATQTFPFFEIPNWAVRLIIVLLLLGFPMTLVLAWSFERSPEGIKRNAEEPPSPSHRSRRGRQIAILTVAAATIAGGLLVWRFIRPVEKKTASLPPAVAAAPAVVIPQKSIAVLPFENLSEEKSNAFFATGIQDEILTRLAKIGALKVISRTSTAHYATSPDNLPSIARELGVANILEGSVQKAGNLVHINVQLIQAATDTHLWAETYERELENIFGVQGEVAAAIAGVLNAKLTGAEQKAVTAKPTSNPAAYEAYLKALSVETTSVSRQAWLQSADGYAETVRLDPDFALAWARLAMVRSKLYNRGYDRGSNPAAAVLQAADRAFALAPEAGESWLAQGYYRYHVQREFSEARQAFEQARQRLPNSADVLTALAFVERRTGRFEASLAHLQQAIELDPRNALFLISQCESLYSLRRFSEAQALVDRLLLLTPSDPANLTFKAYLYQMQGKLEESGKVLQQIPENSDLDEVLGNRAWQFLYERRFDAAIPLIKSLAAAPKSGEALGDDQKTTLPTLGFCQQWAGQTAEAQATFARAIQEIKPAPDTILLRNENQISNALALAYAGHGDRALALEQARQSIIEYQDDAVLKPNSEVTLAQIQAHFGDLDAAIAALPHLLEVPWGLTLGFLQIDPMWDPLRQDPRFQKLLADAMKQQKR